MRKSWLATLPVSDAMLSTLPGTRLVSRPLNQDRTFLTGERELRRTGGMLIGVATCSTCKANLNVESKSGSIDSAPKFATQNIDQAALTAVVLRLRVGDGGLVVDGRVGVGVGVRDVAVSPAVRHHVVRRDGHHGGDGVALRQHSSCFLLSLSLGT